MAVRVVVEEELHLLDARHLGAVPKARELTALLPPGEGTVRPGRTDGQLRLVTAEVDDDAAVLRAAVMALRARAADAGRAVGVRLVGCGLPPLRNWPGRLGDRPAPAALTIRIPTVPAPAVDRVRPWLPVLLAASASSPWRDGADTGRASARWPDPQPDENSGLVVGVFDSAPRIDDVVRLALTVTALVERGPDLSRPDDVTIAAALGRAAVDGLDAVLDDPFDGTEIVAGQLLTAMSSITGQVLDDVGPYRRLRDVGTALDAARLAAEETTAGLPRGEIVRRPAGAALSADERRLLAERPPHHG